MINELSLSNQNHTTADARMASLEAQIKGLETELKLANGDLAARRDKVRLLR